MKSLLYQKMARYFQKKIFPKILHQIFEKLRISLNIPTPLLLTVEYWSAYQMKGPWILYKKMKRYFQKN